MMKKLRTPAGETLVETLFAMLVITLALVMLAGAIVSAARVNSRTRELNTQFSTVGAAQTENTAHSLVHDSSYSLYDSRVLNTGSAADVTLFTTADDNAYIYYRTADAADGR